MKSPRSARPPCQLEIKIKTLFYVKYQTPLSFYLLSTCGGGRIDCSFGRTCVNIKRFSVKNTLFVILFNVGVVSVSVSLVTFFFCLISLCDITFSFHFFGINYYIWWFGPKGPTDAVTGPLCKLYFEPFWIVLCFLLMKIRDPQDPTWVILRLQHAGAIKSLKQGAIFVASIKGVVKLFLTSNNIILYFKSLQSAVEPWF